MQAFSSIDNCLIYDFRFMPIDRSIPKMIIYKAHTNLAINKVIKKLREKKNT